VIITHKENNMNKLAVITGFLGAVKNRYMQYQDDRPLERKFEVASRIENLDGLECCYPADFGDYEQLKTLLDDYGLGVSAVNFRSRRTGKWLRGSFTSADAGERQEVVDDMKRVMDYAADLGCNRITTCTLNEGHDYVFEADYRDLYRYAEETFAACCEYNPEVKISIEYKWNDPRARTLFATAGESLAFCQSVGLDNLGVTMDIGHSLYGREKPAQSVAMLARADRLFYVHLNDNDRSWDWDMIPGAYHVWEFVEFFYYLKQVGYTDDWYAYDVFPKEIDTAENMTTALQITRQLEGIADRFDVDRVRELTEQRNPSESMRYMYSLLK
jgi:xylose isomerase